MERVIKFLFGLALILAPSLAGLNVFAQNSASARLITEFIGDEVSSSSLRGVPKINIGEIGINDPTLVSNPLEISVAWEVRKARTITILEYKVDLMVRLKDGRTFQERKSVGATETQVKFAFSPTAGQRIPSSSSTAGSVTAAPVNRKEDQRSPAAGAQRAGASSSDARVGNDARRTASRESNDARSAAAGDSPGIVPKIAVESIRAIVIPIFTTPLFTSEFSRQKSFKF